MKTVKYIFKSLINNNVALEGRHKKWWFALIIFIVSLILSLIPTMVTIGTADGSNFLKGNTYSADIGLQEFVKDLNDRGINLIVEEKDGKANKVKHQLMISAPDDTEIGTGDTPLYQYKHFDGENESLRLTVYYRDETQEETTKFINSIQQRIYNAESEKDEEKIQPSSYFILGRERMYLAIFDKAATKWNTPKAQYAGDYIKVRSATNINQFYVEGDSVKTMDRWADFFDNGYLNLRSSALLIQTGAYFGINALVVLFMGMMIFIITRGKKNPLRPEYTLGKAMKVVSIASLAPALLTCGLGFIFPNISSMLFMLLIGFRTMWMSSKNLNPAIYVQNEK